MYLRFDFVKTKILVKMDISYSMILRIAHEKRGKPFLGNPLPSRNRQKTMYICFLKKLELSYWQGPEYTTCRIYTISILSAIAHVDVLIPHHLISIFVCVHFYPTLVGFCLDRVISDRDRYTFQYNFWFKFQFTYTFVFIIFNKSELLVV